MKNMTSIVILSYNTLDMLQMCITSIRGFTEPNTYEIIVVDNASKDGSAEWLKTQDDIRCIFNKENLGFPKGCNQGMAIAKGSEILLLNSDVIVTPRWLSQMKKALYSDKKIGAVSCVTSYCSNMQQIEIPYDRFDFEIDELVNFAEKYNSTNPAKWIPYYSLIGYCMLFPTAIYKKIGDMDEQFTPGNYEDDDYSIRIRLAGYKLLVCHDTFIHHFGSGSFLKASSVEERKRKAEKTQALLSRNEKIFFKKWNILNGYKKLCMMYNDFFLKLAQGTKVLVAGRGDAYSLFAWRTWFKNIKFGYLTDDVLESKLVHNEFDLYYSNTIYSPVEKLVDSYDVIIIMSSITDDLEKQSLVKAFNKISGKTIIIAN